MSTGLENKIKFNFNQPNFQHQFGGKTGTVSEKRKEDKKGNSDNIANIIGASAEGLDSVTNFVSLFTGKTPSNQTNQTAPPPPPPKKKVSPFVWIGSGVLVLLLIILLITSKNGQTAKPQT